MHHAHNVIAISYAKRALLSGTREQERMKTYGSVLASYHLIVFTKKSEGYPTKQTFGNVTLYATNTRTRIGSLLKAYHIARTIMQNDRSIRFVVSGQDPLWTGVVAFLSTRMTQAWFHLQMHGDVFNSAFFSRTTGIRMRELALFLLCRADKVRVVSSRIARSLTPRGVSPHRVVVVPIQADLRTFLPIGEGRTYPTRGPVRFLYAGRLAPEKDLDTLLEAFGAVLTEQPDSRLTLIGDGPCREHLQTKGELLGISDRIEFLSWTETLPAVMATHDVFCLSSRHEGFGMVLLEAMAAGMPIVTTDVGCAGDLVRSSHEGEVVPVGDTRAFAAALCRLAKDGLLRAEYGRAGHLAATAATLPEPVYLQRIAESFTVE